MTAGSRLHRLAATSSSSILSNRAGLRLCTPKEMFRKEHSGASKDNRASSSGKGATMEYIAYLHKDKNSDFGVSFPDFPGCITAGSSLDEARAMAAEALALHVAGMRE